MTGFQRAGLDLNEIKQKLTSALSQRDKCIPFIQKRLRGALDVTKKGGSVVMIYNERKFKPLYDNRRSIVIPEELKGQPLDYPTGILLDTLPFENAMQCKIRRSVRDLMKKEYLRYDEAGSPLGKSTVDQCRQGVLVGALNKELEVTIEQLYEVEEALKTSLGKRPETKEKFEAKVLQEKAELKAQRKISSKCVGVTKVAQLYVQYFQAITSLDVSRILDKADPP